MNKINFETALLSISLDRLSKIPLQRQLLQAIRDLVHTGRLRSGMRLPSSRNLALELAVSRVTTIAVYEQLIAEGYLEARRGSGVYIAPDLPDLPIGDGGQTLEKSLEPLPANQPLRPFEVGSSDISAFPYRDWTRLHDRIWRMPKPEILGHPHPFGFGPLRHAIAAHLAEWRGLQCMPAQIIVTSGLVDALGLISKSVFSEGETVLVEDPGHRILANALTSAGINCVPVRVDAHGFNLAQVAGGHQMVRAITVTPSRQYPLGMTLPLARRLEIIEWAKQNNGFILEDDYDGEFRYQGQPLPAIMSLDDAERVIYIGSFSKVMFPALRLGYMVVPPTLIPKIEAIFALLGTNAAQYAQPALAAFISEGLLATHIRRMRRLYAKRQKALLKALQEHGKGLLTVKAETGGMHLVALLTPELSQNLTDTDISELARELGLTVPPLTDFFLGNPDQQGLIFGYAAYSEEAIELGIRKLMAEIRRKSINYP